MNIKYALVLGTALVAGAPAIARADYWSEQQEERLRHIEYMFDQYKPPAWWDGQRVAPGTSADVVVSKAESCAIAYGEYTKDFSKIDVKFRTSPRGLKLEARARELGPHCQSLRVAADAMAKQAAAEKARAAEEAKVEAGRAARRQALLRDLMPYSGTFIALQHAYDATRFPKGGNQWFSQKEADYVADLDAARKVCAAHADDILDPPEHTVREKHVIWSYPTALCGMASLGGKEVIRRAYREWVRSSIAISAEGNVEAIDTWLAGGDPSITDRMQWMLYDRPRWIAEESKSLTELAAKSGEPVPPDAFAPVFEAAAKLQARIDQDGTTRAYEKPRFRNAAAEKLIKRGFAKEFPGGTIVSIGATYKAWAAYDEKTWVKSDAQYDYYRVQKGKNKYMRGLMLVKLPGRPYCQQREWIVRKSGGAAMEIDFIQRGGVFVKCT